MYYITLIAQLLKNLPAMQETWVQFLDWEDPLEKEMATHSSILAWRVPWTEEPGRLQSMGSQTVGCDLATKPPPLLHNPLLSLFTLNAQIVSDLASRRLFQGDSCILLTYLQYFLSIYFLAQSIPGSSCTFSDPALHSGTSPRYSSSLLWRVQQGNQIWAVCVLIATGVSLLPSPLSRQFQEIHMRTHTLLSTFMSICWNSV